MALVHSRVRRVVFGIADVEMGGLGGAATANSGNRRQTGIHFLPGTNHHYRAFRLDTDSSDKYEKTVELIESVTNLHRRER